MKFPFWIKRTPVPKIIHQIWLGDKTPPVETERWVQSAKTSFPDHQYVLWTEDTIQPLAKAGKINHLVYDRRLNPAMRSDALRYEILRQIGGMYLDLDVEVILRFDQHFIPGHFHFGYERSNFPGNAILAAPPGHPFAECLVKHLMNLPAVSPGYKPDVVGLTGPGYMVKALNQYTAETLGKSSQAVKRPLGWHHRELKLFAFDGRILYPYAYGQMTHHQFDWARFPEAYAAHHYLGTWLH